MSERFNKAMKALTKGFFNGTLRKGDCAACACGNIVAAALNIELVTTRDLKTGFLDDWIDSKTGTFWYTALINLDEEEADHLYITAGEQEIEKTGYTPQEMLLIERAFELNTEIPLYDIHNYSDQEIMDDQYNGLCAVVEVLCKLEGYDPEEYMDYFSFDADLKQVKEFVD